MGIVLGPNQYGKAENRVVRPYGPTRATVLCDDAPPAGRAGGTVPGFV